MTEELERLWLHVGQAYGQAGVWVLDPTVTDAEREQAGLPTLEETYAAVLEENLKRVTEASSRDGLPPGVQIERVRREHSPADLERRLKGEQVAVWADGDELTVGLRSEAPFGYVASGFEMPLWPTELPDIRTATVRIRNLDRATLWLRVTETQEVGNAFAAERVVADVPWRGPNAPPPPARVRAEEHTHEVPSAAMAGTRTVRVAMPDQKPEFAIFGTDGITAAPIIRALERRGLVPPVAIFGVHAAMASGGDYLARLDEYYYGRDPAVFEPHHRFFTSELPAWIEANYGLTAPRERTLVLGGSAGGRFALELPILNPDQFGMAIALSCHMELEPAWSDSAPIYGLGSGTLEDPDGNMRKIGDKLSAAGAAVQFHEWVGGHDGQAWHEAIAALLPELLAGS